MGFGGFDIMFSIVPIIIGIVFIFVFGTLIFRAINYGAQKSKPEQTSSAQVLSKRQHVWGEHSHTSYYATFELDNGERVEYLIPDKQIGFLVEGDVGRLTYQGTLFVSFSRQTNYAEYE